MPIDWKSKAVTFKKFYNEVKLPSLHLPAFFNEQQVIETKQGFYNIVKALCKDFLNIDDYKSIRVTEMNFEFDGLDHGKFGPIESVRIVWGKKIHDYFYLTEHDEAFYKWSQEQDWTWALKAYNYLTEGFQRIERPGVLRRMAMLNFAEGFEIHSDGCDAECKTKTREELDVTKELPLNDYYPTRKNRYKYYHQGLVTIENDRPRTNGTVVFNQWFPYSIYWDLKKIRQSNMYHGEADDFSKKTRQAISFRKGEKPFRFGEHIRNYTDQPATDEMVDAILKDTTHLNRDDLKEALYGLSIDKVLMFNDPGTLNTWDNTALHMTKPFFINPYSGIVGVNQESRLCLQYETVEKWIKI